MILRSRKRINAIRRKVRAEIKRSRELKREFKRVRKGRQRHTSQTTLWFFLLFFFFVPWFFIAGPRVKTPEMIQGFLACLTVLFTGWALWRVDQFQACLKTDGDLWVYGHLPFADSAVWRLQWRKFLFQPRVMFLMVPLIYAVLSLLTAPLADVLFAPLVFAVFVHSACVATTVYLAIWLPWLPHRALGIACFAIAGGLSLWLRKGGVENSELYSWVFWLPPFGWINYLYFYGYLAGEAAVWLLLLPLSAMTIALSQWRALLETRLIFAGEKLSLAPVAAPQVVGGDTGQRAGPDEQAPAPAPDVDADEQANSIRERLTNQDCANEGWVDRFINRFLSPREKHVARVLSGGEPNWTGEYYSAIRGSAVTLAIVFFIAGFAKGLILYGCLIAIILLLPATGGTWSGFASMRMGGQFSPLWAGFPIAYREIVRVFLKVNFARILIGAPLIFVCAAVVAYRSGTPVELGMSYAFKLLLLTMIFQPGLATIRLSICTGNYTWPARLMFIVMLPFVVLFALSPFGVFLFDSWKFQIIAWSATIVASTGLMLLYQFLFQRGWFDLLNPQPDRYSTPNA